MKTDRNTIAKLLLVSVFVLGLAQLVTPANATLYYLSVEIEGATGGYTLPGVGNYTYQAEASLLEIFAYPYPGYYFAGWLENGVYFATAYNPIQISRNIGSENVSFIVAPVFSTSPIYTLNVSSIDNIWVDVNGHSVQALNSTFGGGLVQIQGGTTVNIHFPASQWYDFTSWLINGTTTVTETSFSFTMNGNTSILVNESYNAPNTGGTALGPWISYIAPAVVCLILSYGFMELGERIGGYSTGGFIIGGGIGLLICAMFGLIPVWIVTVGFMLAIFAGYFWFRGG